MKQISALDAKELAKKVHEKDERLVNKYYKFFLNLIFKDIKDLASKGHRNYEIKSMKDFVYDNLSIDLKADIGSAIIYNDYARKYLREKLQLDLLKLRFIVTVNNLPNFNDSLNIFW